jgi:flagellin
VSFQINTNIASLQAQQYLRVNSEFQSKTINRVTSGLRIISSGDDAAGLAVANSFRSDQSVLMQGIRNANDGLSTLQTIDGGMNNISQLLDRARTLATQSASQTFTGDRGVLDGEFQNVLAEINRQAQSIGMTSGGDFTKSLSVFIGGGRGDSSSTSAIANGSVTVDLSGSKLDSTSLGLSANGVSGVDVRSGTSNLSDAIAAAATDAQLDFTGAGFSSLAVDFSANFDVANIHDENDLVNAINTAITGVAATNTAFAAANIRASVDSSTGELTFTSSSAFSVIDGGGGSGAAFTLLGGATALNAAVSSVTQAGADLTAGNETLTFSFRNSVGDIVKKAVALANATIATAADIAAAVNADTTLAGYGIFAVATGGNIAYMKADGGAFELSADLDATGVGGVAAGVYGSSTTALGNSSSVDINSASNATSAVTSLATAVANLGRIQGTIGRAQNQLSYAVNLAQSQLTNLAAAESRVRDADLASEAANLSKAQILLQAGTAAVAQANSAPQAVLALLRG